ncbi:MAG TPA: Ig-like domain-containing protein [Spirochaetota bacterium]|nr:Ig-like domain-containing protein [Spirochaetota bacterium]
MKNYNILFVLMIILLLGVVTRCDFNNDFTQPEVVSITPADRASGVSVDMSIAVVFSKEMDTIKTSNEFSLSSDAGTVEGYFSWSPDRKRLGFQPARGLGEATLYHVSISSAAEDASGNDLGKAHSSVFSVSADLVRPTLAAHAPPNDTMVAPDAVISFLFSEAIDLNSLYGGVSISPPLEGRYSWNITNSFITFTPLYPMPYGTTYAVTVGTDIRDTSGNRLADAVFFNFTVGDDFTKPTLAVSQPPSTAFWSEDIENQGVEKSRDILILFSEEIAVSELRNALTISPAATFFIDTDPGHTIAYLKFLEPLASEAHYTLRISPTITDLQNNPLAKEYRFHFFTNGPGSIAPYITSITDPKLPGGWAFGQTQPLSFELSPTGELWYPDIRVRFSARMNPTSLAITIDKVLGTGTTPRITGPDWPDVPPDPKLGVYQFDLTGVMSGNVYKFTIKGGKNGANDLNGNYLKEDFIQYVRF